MFNNSPSRIHASNNRARGFVPQSLEASSPRLKKESLRPNEVLLRAKNLYKSFGGQRVLNDISLELHRGEVVLLQGGNGSGKTTLLNILTGNLKPDRGSIELFANHTLTRFNFPQPWYSLGATLGNAGFAPERLSRQGIGRSWQDIRLFSSQTLRDNIAVAAPNQSGENPIVALFSAKNVQSQERHLRQDVTERLGRLGLSDRENSSADKVSLGQAKRVAIIRAVQTGAKILFLDEPLAGLDAPGATSVLNLLQELVREHSLCLVIVEHVFNIPRVLSLTSTVWTLENGLHIDEASQISPTQENAQEEEKEFGWARELGASEQENLPGEATLTRFCDASSSATLPPSTHSSSVIPAQLPIDARIHAQGSASPGREVILEVEDLAVVRGARQVIGQESQKGLSFCLRRGEVLVLRAPNGWGKTTLFEALAGLVPPTRGTIRLFGQAVENLPVWERRKRGLGLLQARNHTFPGLTVRETLHMTGIRSWPSALDSLLQRRISSLSGGEKQQVALECVLGHADVPILLLDEPFSALDAVAISDVIERVKARLPYCGVLIALPASREAHHHEARHHEDSEREKN